MACNICTVLPFRFCPVFLQMPVLAFQLHSPSQWWWWGVHWKCIGLKQAPRGNKWLCVPCKAVKAKQRRRRRRRLPRLPRLPMRRSRAEAAKAAKAKEQGGGCQGCQGEGAGRRLPRLPMRRSRAEAAKAAKAKVKAKAATEEGCQGCQGQGEGEGCHRGRLASGIVPVAAMGMATRRGREPFSTCVGMEQPASCT